MKKIIYCIICVLVWGCENTSIDSFILQNEKNNSRYNFSLGNLYVDYNQDIAYLKPLKWDSLNYDSVKRTAKAQNKIMFTSFCTTWCGWCKIMDRTTFVDTTVVIFLNKYCLLFKIDGDKLDNSKRLHSNIYNLTDSCSIYGYPTFWIRKPNYSLVKFEGYRLDSKKFLAQFK